MEWKNNTRFISCVIFDFGSLIIRYFFTLNKLHTRILRTIEGSHHRVETKNHLNTCRAFIH